MRDRKLEPQRDAEALMSVYRKHDIHGNTSESLTIDEMTLIFSIATGIRDGWITSRYGGIYYGK